MAQTIVTLCDVHLDKGEDVPGAQTWAFSVGAPSSKPRGYELDLCPDCSGQFGALVVSMTEHARQTSGSSKPLPVASGVDQPVACPECGHITATRQGMDSHLKRKHGITATAGTEDHACPVPGCGRTFSTGQGVSMHITRSHPETR